MTEKQWFKTGDEGLKRSQELAEERERNQVNRLWLPVGKGAKITFLDSEGFFFSEHQIKLNGSWRNWFTCRSEFSECPLCESGDRPSYVCAYTIIDHSKYTSKKTGKEVANVKKLAVFKSTVHNMWARRKSQDCDGDMTYCLFNIHRDKAEHTATGEDVQFVKRLSQAEVLRFKPAGMSDEEWMSPYDYMELFKPQSVDYLRNVVNMAPPIGADDQPSGGNGHGMPVPAGAQAVGGDADIEDLLLS